MKDENRDSSDPARLETIKRRIAEIGPRFDEAILAETRALYRPLLPAPSDSVTVRHDIPYGADARQRLDLYAPRGAAGRPVLIYVPGGAFIGGDKASEDGFYANIGDYFAAHGFVVLIMNYRLAPAHPWPAGAEDIAGLVAWAMQHAAEHGGDTRRVAIFGQSAGASHTLTWLVHPVIAGARPVAAVVLSSGGSYRIAGDQQRPNVKAYFGSDPSQYEQRSAMTHVAATRIPFLLTVSEFDPPVLASPTFELAAKLTMANGRTPQFRWLAGHNHVSQVQSIGTADGEFGSLVLQFLTTALS